MKKSLLFFTLTMLTILFFNGTASAFSNNNFKGSYAFRLVGPSSIVLANEPRTVATGLLVADGKGKVIGHGSFRSAGITCMGKMTGSYNIKVDGTGILTSVISTSTPGCFTSVLDLAIVLSNQGESFEVANTENDYMSGTLTRQNKTNFKLNDLSGSYALRLEGPSSIVRTNEAQTVGVGLITSDGRGKITGNGTFRSAGATCHGSLTGSYRIDPDGTGIIATNFVTSDLGCFTSVVDLSVALFKKGNGVEVANNENDYMEGSLNRQILK